MSVRRRVLVLAPFPPDANGLHGGARVVGQLLEHLAARHDMLLVYVRGPGEDPISNALRTRLVAAEELARPDRMSTAGGRSSRALHRIVGLLRGRPVWASDWAVRGFRSRISRIVDEWQPEIVHAEYQLMAQFLRPTRAAQVLVMHEPGVRAAGDIARRSSGLWRLARAVDLRAWCRFERSLSRAVDAVVVFTDADRDALLTIAGQTPVVTIQPGVSTDPSATGARPAGARLGIVFVGSFVHPPNVDAAVRLARSIFPRVLARTNDARLVIVGNDPPADLRALASDRVVVTGRVPAVEPYLDEAAVVAAPLRIGGGIRIKMLEALAAGKAIVATSRAIEGLRVIDGEHLLLAESDAEFADAIVSLLRDTERRDELGAAGQAWAAEHLGWARSIAAYEDLWQRLRPVPP